MKVHYFECECSHGDHLIRYMWEEGEDELWTEIRMNPYHSFFSRIWLAIKYIFGYNCVNGHFDCTMLSKQEAGKLVDLLVRYQNAGPQTTISNLPD
jgi:hypothetical protein